MVSIKLYAGTDIGLRDNNEDNFTVCPDLQSGEWIVPGTQSSIPLGRRGCLVVVADGMGGQNAGEVASAITIDTVQRMFAPTMLTDSALSRPVCIRDYMVKVIKEADVRVKKYGAEHPEAEGLGSTIVMAWIIGKKAYVAWLGDSRVYSLRCGEGAVSRLTKDHSYVQRLVDAGRLSEEQAMAHPDSNIITRSVGDTFRNAEPEVTEHELTDGEVLLLCSDGLCGVCTDAEMLRTVTAVGPDRLRECKKALVEAALEAGGSDNITVALAQVAAGDDRTAADTMKPDEWKSDTGKDNSGKKKEVTKGSSVIIARKLSLLLFGILVAAVCVGVMMRCR